MQRYDPLQFAVELARLTEDFKCTNVVALDLRGISTIMDFTVIATGTSQRQLRAIADHVITYGKKLGQRPFGLCGYEASSWVVIDFFDVVVHVFTKAYRDFYDLELLWGDAQHLTWARAETA